MDVLNTNKSLTTISFSLDELLILANSFNEVCNGIKINNFEEKISVPLNEADLMLEFLGELYEKVNSFVEENKNENT